MIVLLTPEAEADLRESHSWYLNRSDEVANDFLQTLFDCGNTIVRYPQAFPVVLGNARRAVLQRFPYNIIFTIEGEIIYIHAIYHGKRAPVGWMRRIKD